MALTDLTPTPAPCKCRVCRILTALDETDRVKFTGWLNDPAHTGTSIATHMTGNGHPLNGDQVRRWRGKQTTCGQDR